MFLQGFSLPERKDNSKKNKKRQKDERKEKREGERKKCNKKILSVFTPVSSLVLEICLNYHKTEYILGA